MADLNARNRKTLHKIFTKPIRNDIKWDQIEGLFEALGGKIKEGRGSRVRVRLNDVQAVFHRPHPKPHTDKGSVASVKRFLIGAGIKP